MSIVPAPFYLQPPKAALQLHVIRRLAAAQDALWPQTPQLPQACV
jgi:hypothetical protein